MLYLQKISQMNALVLVLLKFVYSMLTMDTTGRITFGGMDNEIKVQVDF